jgi:hypothetical protein
MMRNITVPKVVRPSLAANIAATLILAALSMATPTDNVYAQAVIPPAASEEKPENFPAGAGRDDTFYFCTACHNFKLVAQQGMTREQWDESLTWMTARHKMPVLEGKDRDIILGYLALTYGPKTTGPQRGWKNPFQP